MEKVVIGYNIPIQGEEQCKRYNKMCKELHGAGNFETADTTEVHIETLLDQLYDAIDKIGSEGGWYVGDSIKVNIEIEYEPEDK